MTAMTKMLSAMLYLGKYYNWFLQAVMKTRIVIVKYIRCDVVHAIPLQLKAIVTNV